MISTIYRSTRGELTYPDCILAVALLTVRYNRVDAL